jgi:hypothetical protein
MKKAFTIATPRYSIESVKGAHFDIFNQRLNAIKAAIKLAVEYPGNTFIVVKKVNHTSKTIFSFKVEVQMELDDLQEIYQGIIDTYQIKKDKTKYWRKSDVT